MGAQYFCVAAGILEPGEHCIADAECIEGAHCSLVDSSGEQRCRKDECTHENECGDGEICRDLECHTTLGGFCLDERGEYGCAPHELCRSETCVAAPSEGGNECADDTQCARGLACKEHPQGGFRCSSCMGDEQCTTAEAPYCYEGHCAGCNASSCAPGQCDVRLGCVDCFEDEHCGDGERCMNMGCRLPCTSHEQCESGRCEGSTCIAALGKGCTRESYNNDFDCFGGACVGMDDNGASVPTYCTRECHSSQPCPNGYECVEDVEILGSRVDLCLVSP